MTGSVEPAGTACMASTETPANGLASRRSAGAISCLIATVPASGDRLLSQALYNTGLAGHPHEYFRPDFCKVWADGWQLPRGTSVDDYIAAAKSRMRTANGVFSAKLDWHQLVWLYGALAPGAFFIRAHAAELLEARLAPLQYVFLFRRDTARQAISYYRAARGQSRGTGHPDGDGLDSDPIDLEQIRWLEDALIEQRLSWRQYFAAGGIEPIEVAYEDLVVDCERTIASLLVQLGVADDHCPAPQEPRSLPRQADDRSEAILAAYLPMRAHLAPKGLDGRWDFRGRPAHGRQLIPIHHLT